MIPVVTSSVTAFSSFFFSAALFTILFLHKILIQSAPSIYMMKTMHRTVVSATDSTAAAAAADGDDEGDDYEADDDDDTAPAHAKIHANKLRRTKHNITSVQYGCCASS